MCPQLPTPGYELPLKIAFQRALLTPQSSSLWHPSLAAQGDSGFKNGIVRGVPFLGKYSCLVDVISAVFFFFFVLKDFQTASQTHSQQPSRRDTGEVGVCLCGRVFPPCVMQGRNRAVD